MYKKKYFNWECPQAIDWESFLCDLVKFKFSNKNNLFFQFLRKGRQNVQTE